MWRGGVGNLGVERSNEAGWANPFFLISAVCSFLPCLTIYNSQKTVSQHTGSGSPRYRIRQVLVWSMSYLPYPSVLTGERGSTGDCREHRKVDKFWHSQIRHSHFQLSEFWAMGKHQSFIETKCPEQVQGHPPPPSPLPQHLHPHRYPLLSSILASAVT